jgi:Domain of unknown function (DUF5049)
MPKRFESPVLLPLAVFEGLEAVQESGRTNMLDHRAVQDIATRIGYPEAARWIDEHVDEYSEGLFQGFVAAE